ARGSFQGETPGIFIVLSGFATTTPVAALHDETRQRQRPQEPQRPNVSERVGEEAEENRKPH
ncbi:hypothetical protein O5559_28140, partial [Escherichia coli]|nr:hypothetical protein [Escherichia coli]